jgi:uncharacterized protein YwgA
MPRVDNKLDSVALIAHLIAQAAPRKRLGRTALMKCLFFLKVLKQVPLPYSFGLYTYGPFDSDVLDDLKYGEALGAVKGTLVQYPGGQGYEYEGGPNIEQVEKTAKEFLSRHEKSIDWVLSEFGSRTAIDLEMASTLVFIDRVTNAKKAKATIADLARKVHDVKPHLELGKIEQEARALKEKGLLEAVA